MGVCSPGVFLGRSMRGFIEGLLTEGVQGRCRSPQKPLVSLEMYNTFLLSGCWQLWKLSEGFVPHMLSY
jgi:hypothetical protein